MTAKRYLYISVILLILMFFAVFDITSSADAQKVYALLIILGNDRDIRDSVNVNDSNMQTLLRLLSENCEVHMTVMKSADETTGTVIEKTLANADVTAQNSPQQLGIIKANQVTAWIRNLQPNSDDTILIYYSGHGMINEDGVHILNFDPNVSNDSVTRVGLRKRLMQKQVHLKMLITDTCSNQAQGFALIAKSYGRVVPRKRRYTEDLFLKHKGFLDITAASPGQYAWGNNQIGGYFTAALIQSFTSSSDADKDAFLSWKEVFSATRDETQRLFSETTFLIIEKRKMGNIGQTTQTPKKYSLPGRLARSSPAVLSVTSTPSGASVYIDDIRVGKTPLEGYEVDVGANSKKVTKIRLELEGYKNRERVTFTLGGKRYGWRNVPLEKLAATPTDPQKKNNGIAAKIVNGVGWSIFGIIWWFSVLFFIERVWKSFGNWLILFLPPLAGSLVLSFSLAPETLEMTIGGSIMLSMVAIPLLLLFLILPTLVWPDWMRDWWDDPVNGVLFLIMVFPPVICIFSFVFPEQFARLLLFWEGSTK